MSAGGTVLTISQLQDGSPVDVLRVTLTNTTSGAYTVQQLNEIDHSIPGVSEENLLLNVNYRVTDGDGDTIDGALSIDVDDDTPTIVADDICQDVPAEPGDVANFVLVLDTSGSIESSQLSLIQDAVENLLNQLGGSGAQDIRVHIVEFGTTASSVGTYDIVSGGTLNASVLADAIADVNALNSGGSTNYEAGFQQALPFIQGGPRRRSASPRCSRRMTPTARRRRHRAYRRQWLDADRAGSGWTSPATPTANSWTSTPTGGITDGWGASPAATTRS